jgi:hypothetical protein
MREVNAGRRFATFVAEGASLDDRARLVVFATLKLYFRVILSPNW